MKININMEEVIHCRRRFERICNARESNKFEKEKESE